MNKLFLKLVLLPSALWKGLGADLVQLEAILNTRLILDDRKPMTIGKQDKPKKDRKYGSLLGMFIYTIMGFVYMMPLVAITDRIISLAFYFFFLLTVITLMLITDFSNVLFDSRDKYILFPRPVNDRTLVLARMLHVFIYLLRIILPLSLPGWVIIGIMDGWQSAVLFPLPLVLLVAIALFLVNSVYLLVLRLAKPEKFKDVINYFQVLASIVFFASVYTLPRLFDIENRKMFNILEHTWIKYLPSYWLASCWSWIGYKTVLPGTFIYSILAIVLPLACMYILVRWLSPQFSRRISGIDTVDTGATPVTGTVKRSGKGRLYQKLAYAFNRTDDAKAGFMIAWLQTSRSRSFRMRVYPTFAYIPVYFFFVLNQNSEGFKYAFQHLHDRPKHLLLLYMSSFVMISAMSYVTMSDQYKAAWVYYSTPIQVPGRIMLGAFKAIWVKYFLPFFLTLSAFTLYVWGADALTDIILALVNVTLFVSCIARITYRHLPFSMMEQMKQKGSQIIKSLVVMIVPALLGFGHYFSIHLLWLKLIFLVLSAILLWLVWDSYANTTWENVVRSESE